MNFVLEKNRTLFICSLLPLNFPSAFCPRAFSAFKTENRQKVLYLKRTTEMMQNKFPWHKGVRFPGPF